MRETLVKTEEFKDSPVKKIPKDWEIVSLKNEINILHGYAFKGEYFADEPPGNVLLVPGNFHRDGGLYFDENNTKYYRGLTPDGTVLENGELLIVMTDLSPRTLILGRVVLLELPFRVLHNQRIGKIVLKLPDTWDKRFLLLVMNSDRVRRNIISNATGTTVRHTSPDRIIANVVPKPPVEEQSKIADILDTIDAAIAHTSSLIAKLKQMKAGLLHDLLTRGLDENGELRDAIAHPEQFKDSPLGRIPKDWKVSSVEGEFDITTGFTLGEHRRPRKNKRKYLRVANVQREEILLDDIAELEAEDREFSSCLLEKDDLLIVEGHANPDEIGRCAIVPTAAVGLTFQNHLFRLRCRDIEPKFALAWLNSEWVRAYWRRLCGTSSGLNTINRTMLNAIPIPAPEKEEQRHIIAVIDTQKKRICTEEAYRNKLKVQKEGLMHDLLSGKVRIVGFNQLDIQHS